MEGKMDKKELKRVQNALLRAKNILEKNITPEEVELLKVRADIIKLELYIDSLIWKPAIKE